MKKIIAVMCLLVFGAATGHAQDSSASRRLHRPLPAQGSLLKELNLTAEQQQQIKLLNDSTKVKRQAIVQDTRLDRAGKREQLKQLSQATQKNIADILTKEQRDKWKALRKQRKQYSPTNPGASPNDTTATEEPA